MWPFTRKTITVEKLVIAADVPFSIKTQQDSHGTYLSHLVCPCSRSHFVVHYKLTNDVRNAIQYDDEMGGQL